MKWVIALVLASAPAAAEVARTPEPAVRKAEPQASDKFAKAASEAFGQARAADEAGKLRDALRLYEKAHAISPHPNTLYNIADVQRRMTNITLAIKSYRKYLELDPGAQDKATVEKLIRELETMPGTLVIELEESDAQVFLDGAPIKNMTLELPNGDHIIDVITPVSADSERCHVSAGIKSRCRIRLRPRVDGNVFLSGPAHVYRTSVSRNGFRYSIKSRFALDPGAHEITLSSLGQQQCAPIKLDVATGDVVTYVWMDVPKHRPKRGECVTVPARQRTLKF
jgi:tetratricopeptide (TPR) repeat protein